MLSFNCSGYDSPELATGKVEELTAKNAGELFRDRVDARMKEIKIRPADLIGRLEKSDMKYGAAHQLVSRIQKGEVTRLQDKTKTRLEEALELDDIDPLFASERDDQFRHAIVESMMKAPAASDEQIVKDVRSLLKDSKSAPYLRMATKLLLSLKTG